MKNRALVLYIYGFSLIVRIARDSLLFRLKHQRRGGKKDLVQKWARIRGEKRKGEIPAATAVGIGRIRLGYIHARRLYI